MDYKKAAQIVKDFFTKTKGQDTFKLSKSFIEARELIHKINPSEVNEIFREIHGDAIVHVNWLDALMSEDQKKASKEAYDKCMKGLDGPPIFCGPEARAMNEGPEALKKYYEENAKYVRKVNIDDL